MKRIIAAAALMASTITSAHAVEIPDTPAGHVLAMWLDGFNSEDKVKLQAYIDKYHRKSTPQSYIEFHQITGDLSVLKIEKNEPNDLVAVLGETLADDALRA